MSAQVTRDVADEPGARAGRHRLRAALQRARLRRERRGRRDLAARGTERRQPRHHGGVARGRALVRPAPADALVHLGGRAAGVADPLRLDAEGDHELGARQRVGRDPGRALQAERQAGAVQGDRRAGVVPQARGAAARGGERQQQRPRPVAQQRADRDRDRPGRADGREHGDDPLGQLRDGGLVAHRPSLGEGPAGGSGGRQLLDLGQHPAHAGDVEQALDGLGGAVDGHRRGALAGPLVGRQQRPEAAAVDERDPLEIDEDRAGAALGVGQLARDLREGRARRARRPPAPRWRRRAPRRGPRRAPRPWRGTIPGTIALAAAGSAPVVSPPTRRPRSVR